MMFLLPALALGAMGSFHCIGMCGPIAISLPKAGNGSVLVLAGKLSYNAGRIATYAAIGAVLGLVGKGIFLTGMQQGLSIALGLLLLAGLAFPRFFKMGFLYKFPSRVKAGLIPLFKKRGLFFSFLIGMLNGLLPCGLVYMAVAGALATGDPLHGLFFMVFFGLGTLPMMLVASYAGQFLTPGLKVKMQRAIPVFVVLMATVLILRGMNLGIPYLSPEIASKAASEVTVCE